jgi:hypothetical protein
MKTVISALVAVTMILGPMTVARGAWDGNRGRVVAGRPGFVRPGFGRPGFGRPGFRPGFGFHPGYRWGFYHGSWGWYPPAFFALAVGAAIAASPPWWAMPAPVVVAPPPPPRVCWTGWAWVSC